MTPEQYQRAGEIFLEISDAPPEAREALLRDRCGDDEELRQAVRKMLAHDEDPTTAVRDASDGGAARWLGEAIAAADAETAPAGTSAPGRLPERIGSYRIVRLIGQGGMGAVFEAEQSHPKRTVALKVVDRGATSPRMLRRLELEAEALGRLHHPGIAPIYEAGTFDAGFGPQPFFAMELVRGEPLTTAARRRGLDRRARLELMARVCDAVHHAHQRGVIHRDLKPGNILVDEAGQPRVLDFGVARISDPEYQTTTLRTDAGQLVGTVQYMSPEQAGGDPDEIDTRSDVYALGTILYELLAGRPPHDLSGRMLHEAIRIIREDDPPRLSSIDRSLAGDVETIVEKAIEREKTRRYQSAAALADDLRRYLRDEPIVARPATVRYQLSKLARRHRAAVAGIAAVTVVLIAATVVSSVFAVRESSARKRMEAALGQAQEARDLASRRLALAERESETARWVTDWLIELFKGSDPDATRGATVTARELLDEAVAKLSAGTNEQPHVQARLLEAAARVYHNLGLYDEALGLAERSLQLRVETLGEKNLETASAQAVLGLVLGSRGDFDRAEAMYRASLETRRALRPATHTEVIDGLNNLSRLLLYRGREAEAEPLLREAMELQERKDPSNHEAILTLEANLAGVLRLEGRFAEAEAMYRRAVERGRQHLPPDHAHVVRAEGAWGLTLRELNRLDEARECLESALAAGERIWGPDHPEVATFVNNLALVHQDLGHLEQAHAMLQRLLEMDRSQYGPDHEYVALDLSNLASLLARLGEHDEAERMHREAIALFSRAVGEDDLQTLRARRTLASFLFDRGRFEECAAEYAAVHAILLRTRGETDAFTLDTAAKWGTALVKLERFDEAREVLFHAHDVSERERGPDDERTRSLAASIADWFKAQGRADEAAAWRAPPAEPDAP